MRKLTKAILVSSLAFAGAARVHFIQQRHAELWYNVRRKD